MIPLDRIKFCSNPECRLVLPADLDNELAAGFWVQERENGKGSRPRRYNSHCKDCVRNESRKRATRQRRALGRRTAAVVWVGEYEGRLVQFRRCSNPECGVEGPCLDSLESIFPIGSRAGGKIHWRPLCRVCFNAWQKERRKPLSEEQLEVRRARYHERMKDPEYAEYRRAWGRQYYAESPERRASIRAYSVEWRKGRGDRSGPWGDRIRENDRLRHALRAEREGRPMRPRKTVVDGTQPRMPVEPFQAWLTEYGKVSGVGDAYDALGESLDVPPRRICSVMTSQYPRVSIDVVSRALTNSKWIVEVGGRPVVTIDDMYGEEPLRG